MKRDGANVAFVGNPNAGKTTIFNCITNSSHRVGNWAGVTVDISEPVALARKFRSIGSIDKLSFIDTPGLYSVDSHDNAFRQSDEEVSSFFLEKMKPNLIVNVIDGLRLQRGLYLTLQLIEMGFNLIVVINKKDLLAKKGLIINPQAIEERLCCPVIIINATKKKEILDLQVLIYKEIAKTSNHSDEILKEYGPLLGEYFEAIGGNKWHALKFLSSGDLKDIALDTNPNLLLSIRAKYYELLNQQDVASSIASRRYEIVLSICKNLISKAESKKNITPILDRILLNKIVAIPGFALCMYFMFFLTTTLGGTIGSYLERFVEVIVLDGLTALLAALNSPYWLVSLLHGLGTGIKTICSFVPLIGILYFCFSLIEESGYMARIGIVMDDLMYKLSLPGKAAIPLILGFGCNVPAIAATRIMEKKEQRIMTIMILPFMTCGARFAVFVVFGAAFFKEEATKFIFYLYLVGAFSAFSTGYAIKNWISVPPHASNTYLPDYVLPKVRLIISHVWIRIKQFVRGTSRTIIMVSICLYMLNSITLQSEAHEVSLLSFIGKKTTAVFAPIGIDEDNWQAVVGLFAGTLAKEVILSSLSTAYGLEESVLSAEAWPLKQPWAWWETSCRENFLGAENHEQHHVALQTVLAQKFKTNEAVMSYLIFILLYFPCISVFGAISHEVGVRYAVAAVVWSTLFAYSLASLFYVLSLNLSRTLGADQIGLALLLSTIITNCILILGSKLAFRLTHNVRNA